MRKFLSMLFLGQPNEIRIKDTTEIAGRSFRVDYDLLARFNKARPQNHMDFSKARFNQLLNHSARTVSSYDQN